MFKPPSFPRQARGFLLLGILLLILSALPVRPARASLISQKVDDTLPDFTRGTFQRTSLSALQGSPPDAKGAVQLVPIGVLKTWYRSSFTLPECLSDVGGAAIGNHLFVLGGLASQHPCTATPAPTKDVWSVTIDTTTGAPSDTQWFDEQQDLPLLQQSSQFPSTVAARSTPAVTAVATGPDSGYIYVIGGRVQPSGAVAPVSSYVVSIGTVAGGHITGWVSSDNAARLGLRIPADPTWGLNGLQSASALTFKSPTTGKTYVYLLGGLERFRNGSVFQEVGSRQVYYAQVRTSDGMLVKPSSPSTIGWDTLAPIPIPTVSLSNVAGLWDATAVADHFVFGDIVGDALYVIGGQFQSSVGNDPSVVDTYSQAVYRALINTSTGALTWSAAPNPNPWQGLLPTARVGMGGVEFHGKLYLTGGRAISGGSQGPPQAAVFTSYVQDDLQLAQIDNSGTGSNFRYQDNVLGTPPAPRARHGTALVQAAATGQTNDAPAYVYVIAGQGTAADGSDKGSDTLIYGKIGGNEDTVTNGFSISGWYYSASHDTIFTGAQVQEIDWTTVMTSTTMDIQMQYRTSTASDCSSPTAFNSATWQVIDGDTTTARFSKNGFNNPSLGVPPPTHCFQYRARLSNGTSGVPTTTPSLLNVSILVQVPGNPDLKVQTLQDARNIAGKFTGMNVEILNHSNIVNQPTQPANIEGSGSFFIDMFIFGPGQTPVTPTLPLELNPNNPKSAACVNINKNDMGIDSKIAILQWYDPADPTCGSTRKALQPSFTTPGHYVVIVAVDTSCPEHSYGCVNEGSSGGEINNLKRKEFDIVAGQVGYPDTLLPIVRK